MLYHYIIVRRDLPFGVLTAMITHAAGESGALYQEPYDGRFRGAHVVVLGVDSEDDLKRVDGNLLKAGIPRVCVHETASPWNGQFMAIGVVPTERERVQTTLSTLPLLRDLLNPVDNSEEQV